MELKPYYAECFGYVGPHVENRKLYIQDCHDEIKFNKLTNKIEKQQTFDKSDGSKGIDAFAIMRQYIDKQVMDEDADEHDHLEEQSDFVLIILNLAAIPENIDRTFQLQHNFQEDFLHFMQDYKDAFEKQNKKRWQYSNK